MQKQNKISRENLKLRYRCFQTRIKLILVSIWKQSDTVKYDEKANPKEICDGAKTL